MEIIINITTTLFIIQIIIKKGVKKLYWMLCGILFFSKEIVITNIPFIGSPYKLLIYTTLIMILVNKKKAWLSLSSYPLKYSLLFIFLTYSLIGCHDEEKTSVQKIMFPLTIFIENFLLIWISSYFITTMGDIYYIYRKMRLPVFIFTIYGMINYFTKYNIYSKFISITYKAVDFGNYYLKDDRYRISSFSWHPIYYGLLLSISILATIFIIQNVKINKYQKYYLYILLIMQGVNLILVNSRTPLLSLIVGLLIYYIFAIKEKIRIALYITVLLAFSIAVAPASGNLIFETYNTFTPKGSNLQGSSVEMRDGQLVASLIEFNKSPIFGNGFNYIFYGLGHTTELNDTGNNGGFYGFESYAYKLLIEQGLCGILSNLFFFLSIIFSLAKNYKVSNNFNKTLIISNFAAFITFLLFIFGTGDMGSLVVVMALLGINMKTISIVNSDNNKNKLISNNYV